MSRFRVDPWPLPRWIAHRGAGKLAPENTLAAFRVGASHGYRAFECDVKLAADGALFLLHDTTLERTSDGGPRTAGALPWSELSALDAGSWHSRAFAGEPIPRLEAIVRFCRRNGFALNLEIKPTPGQERETGAAVAEAVRRLWASTGGTPGTATAWPVLSSFRPEALFAAQQAAPEIPRALLLDSFWPTWETVLTQLDAAALVTQFRLMDEALVQRLHDEGRRALVYTVNEAEDARHLLALGVDGLITDAVDRFAPGADA
jgi:glycerophosphoryl diester phosphodiesterase